jgi:glycogen(starch) synthase
MRICLTCREYPPETVGGGIGTYTANIARGLATAGHQVSVIARSVKGGETVHHEDGVRVHRILPCAIVGLTYALRGYGDGKTFLDAYLYSRAVAARVRRLMVEDGLDIVQSPEHGAEGFVLARDGAPIPHVVRFHTPLVMVTEAAGQRLSVGGRIVDAMERATARRAALYTSGSHALAMAVAARFRIARERIRVVPNFIDHETFRPASESEAAAFPPAHPPTVLYVGKIAPLKGARVLAEAIPRIVSRVPAVKVIIVGSDHPAPPSGSTKAEMQAVFEEAGVASSVTFLPPRERAALVRLYQGADVCVLPTLWDNFPNTCLEAMACGVPVVATAVGGLPEIIHDGIDGLLVPLRDPEALADAVVRLLSHADMRKTMGRTARKTIVDRYTRERVVAATTAVYEEAIVGSAARAGGGNA